MIFSGIQKLTLLDYPGKVSCIVFSPGCDFRCGYCHNPEFVLPECLAKMKDHFIPEEKVLSFLQKRVGLLDGVVISGGEPTLAPDLIDFMRKVKKIGFLIKLDTNGNHPSVIENALNEKLIDYIAMDIKASIISYDQLVGSGVKVDNIIRSIDIIKNSGVDYEFRSTLIREIHSLEDLKRMCTMVRGSKRLYLQGFRPGHTLDPKYAKYHPFSDEEMVEIVGMFQEEVEEVACR